VSEGPCAALLILPFDGCESMPRKRSEPAALVSHYQDRPQALGAEGVGPAWLAPVVAGLVAARLFVPAESAAQGETLWIVLLWLLCGLAWLFDASRNGDLLRRCDGLDGAVAVLVGGHVISALVVLGTEGQKRAALNSLWEWLGVGVAFVLLRVVLRRREQRDRLLRVIAISGVVLSGLGIWQHVVWYPRISAQLAEMGALQRAPADEDSEAMWVRLQRLEELGRELGVQAVLGDSSGRSFQDRVQASTEPIGRFALANTFAGLLLVALFLVAGGLWRSVQQDRPVAAASSRREHLSSAAESRPDESLSAAGSRRYETVLAAWRAGGWLIGLLLVGYCLWLTKSRTALVGLLCGIVIVCAVGRRDLLARRWLRWLLVAGALVFVSLPVVAALSGGLDRQVISEAPKSLRYRWEYWLATSRLIADHPWLGVGPGNFRQHYLRYKLPGASEEILDPHNLVLDVWANGGVIALAGLLGLLGIAAQRFWRRSREANADTLVSRPGDRRRQTVWLGGVGTAALLLAALVQLMQGTDLEADWLVLAAAWWVTAWLLAPGSAATCLSIWPVTVLMAAALALVVHLTGAGGIAMPAILQLLLILVVATTDVSPSSSAESSAGWARTKGAGRTVGPALLTVGVALVAACVMTAVVPVTTATAAMNLGRVLWLTDGQPLTAERSFVQAATADSLSPEPWQELSRLRLARWLQTSDEADFEDAVAAQKQAISRDPNSAGRWRVLGDLWSLRHQRQPADAFAQEALAAYSEAVQRYPHLADLQADLALAARDTGHAARAAEAARKAMRLDEMNRQQGHIDKYLDAEKLADLLQLIDGSRDGSGNHPDQ
jgi:hypothetical protein